MPAEICFYFRRKNDLLQNTIPESEVFDRFQAFRDHDFPEPQATAESLLPDASEMRWEYQGFQVRATGKSTPTDFREAVRENDPLQGVHSPKSTPGDLGHALRDTQFFRFSLITDERSAYDLKSL